jgi:hypothetical protein
MAKKGRPKGSANIVPFSKRTVIETCPSASVRHLSKPTVSPFEDFSSLLNHQINFLAWLEERNRKINSLTKENRTLKNKPKGKGPSGAKVATYDKYHWYTVHVILLAAINAFENFYKKTFIGLGEILQEYVDLEELKGKNIEATILWGNSDPISAPALIFEQSLFHDLSTIDQASQLLIGERRYNPNQKGNPLKERVRSLRVIFQIRHTLSHNEGLVTTSDASKFRRFQFSATVDEVIDPSKNNFAPVIFKELITEAEEFTNWLAKATASYLQKCILDRAVAVPATKRLQLEALLGVHSCWNSVTWS